MNRATITGVAKQDYIPNREDELLAWYANLAAKLPTYEATLGLRADRPGRK